MRILGFVIAATILHVVLLSLLFDSNSDNRDEFVVGVALVERQMALYARDFNVPSESDPSDTNSDKNDDVTTQTPEPVNTPTMQELAEVDTTKQTITSAAAEVAPEQPADTAQDLSALEAPPLSADMPLPRQQELAPRVTEAVLQTQQPLVRPGMSLPTHVTDGEAVQTAKEPVALQVSAQPRYGYHPAPVYPGMARRRGWEGSVAFHVRVLASGDVAEVVLKDSSGYKILDEAAHKAISRWRFTPAKRQGQMVESWVVVPVHFVLDAQDRKP